MDPIISDLVDKYDSGQLSRRDLVVGLGALAAAGAPAVAAAAQAPSLKPVGLHHVSILVADLKRSAAFYERVFGMVTVSEDVPNKIVRLAHRDVPQTGRGSGNFLVSLRAADPVGTTDHWSFKIEGFRTAEMTEMLKAHGLNPVNNIEYGYHIIDPDGIVVQMV